MKSKVVVFTGYNRVRYFKETLETWATVDLLEEYDFYFRLEPCVERKEMMYFIDKFSNATGIKCNIILNETKLGCGKNTWLAFDEMFDKYNFVVLAEDDITPSKDILRYFSYMENKYRDDKEVAIISANHQEDGFTENLVARLPIFRGQIWGTWKENWDNHIKNTWDFAYDSGVDGGPSGWDWNLTLRILPQFNLKTMAPHSARSQHIGVDGLHSNVSVYPETILSSFKNNYEWTELIEK